MNYSGGEDNSDNQATIALLHGIPESSLQQQQQQLSSTSSSSQNNRSKPKQYYSTHPASFLKKTHDVHAEPTSDNHYNQRTNFTNTASARYPKNRSSTSCLLDGQDDDDNDQQFSTSNTNKSDQNNHHSSGSTRTTDGQTMMHILKANIGTGILAMPSAFRNVGLWLGFILVPLIGAVCIHCMNILISSHNCLCDRFNFESLDYDQVAALSLACGPRWLRPLAKRAQLVVTIFLLLTQMGFCCVYVMFVVENLQLAMYNLFHINYSTTSYLFIIFPVIWLTSCTSNLNHLARISTLANILQFIGLSLILFDLLQFHTFVSSESSLLYSSSNDTLRNITTTAAAANITTTFSKANNAEDYDYNYSSQTTSGIQVSSWPESWMSLANGLPLFFATAVYAFEGIGVVLPLIKEMRYPEHISGTNGVLNTGMRLVAILYMALGFFGYSKYGQTVAGSITLNLPETSLNELVRLVFALGIGLSYSLQFYVPWTIVWPWIDEGLFYSYRPREENRDKKLNFQSKLEWGAAGEWPSCNQTQNNQQPTSQISTLNVADQGEDVNESGKFADTIGASHQSNASTFATSYMVTSHKWAAQWQDQTATGLVGQLAGGATCDSASRPRRNRLDDVVEHESDQDHIPQLEWRPPPRSMRGKRKLVRYTVIFFGVSITFLFAALIPRLDLFISLIGALASSCLAIIFPAIIELCTFWVHLDNESGSTGGGSPDSGRQSSGLAASSRRALFVAKNLLLIVFGLLGLVTGGWQSLSRLFEADELSH